jgi:hypothetical protein
MTARPDPNSGDRSQFELRLKRFGDGDILLTAPCPLLNGQALHPGGFPNL